MILYLFGFVTVVVLSISIWGWVKFIQNAGQYTYEGEVDDG